MPACPASARPATRRAARRTTPRATRRTARRASRGGGARRSLAGAFTTLVVAVTGALAVLPPAEAGTKAQPGSFTGYALDTCDTPSQRAMNAWRRASKYAAIGVYVSGMNRACSTQQHLTPRWVRKQTARGWKLLPLVVGRQASCSPAGYYRGKRISPRAARDYARARAQGAASARGGVEAVRDLGIGRGSVVWFDLEHFDLSRTKCRRSALAFVSAWTKQLHRKGYRSGLYSSAASGIEMVDDARKARVRGRALPDYLWVAEWNGRPTLGSAYISRAGWWPHRRVHQYRGGHTERHGGVAINIDSNWMSTGRGTRAGAAEPHCGVRVDFRRYHRHERGARGKQVGAAQCFLHQQRHLRGKPTGRFRKPTAKAVRSFQRDASLKVTGVLNKPTWTALLARGSTGGRPLLKVGTGNDGVRRLQRALNAATPARLRVDGTFGQREMLAVRQYQRRTGRPTTGVVTVTTWRALRNGHVPRSWSRARKARAMDVPSDWLPVPYSSGAAGPRADGR